MTATTSFYTTPKRNEPPTCFGKDWDNNSPECAGGPDVSFIPKPGEKYAGQDKHGTNIRDMCDWYQSCGARCAAMKNANGQLVPAQQLVRPPQAQAPVTNQPTTFSQWLGQAAREQRVAAPSAANATQVRMPTTPTAPTQQQQPVQVLPSAGVQPATMWQLNYAMPSYLTTPEIRHPGESIWLVLLREVLRATGKAIGHAVAHFFDARALKEK